MLGKLLGLASVGGTIASVSMLQKFLSGITTVVALTIVTAMMAATLMICGFCLLYLELTRNGLDPAVALMLIGGILLLITAGLAAITLLRVKELRQLPMQSLMHKSAPVFGPAFGHMQDIAESFLHGLLTPEPPRPPRHHKHPQDKKRA